MIIRASLASFGALLISQSRFIFMNPLFAWSFLPFVIFTIIYYVISLCVNFGTREFDQVAHRELVASWRPSRYPSLDIFLPICGEPLAVLSQHVDTRVRAHPGIPRHTRPPSSSTTELTTVCGRWQRASGSSGLGALTEAG